jgi:hypothetical protein
LGFSIRQCSDFAAVATWFNRPEAGFGPLAAQPFASQIYGLYTGFVYLNTGFVYLTPLFGGWLADHVLG